MESIFLQFIEMLVFNLQIAYSHQVDGGENSNFLVDYSATSVRVDQKKIFGRRKKVPTSFGNYGSKNSLGAKKPLRSIFKIHAKLNPEISLSVF